MRRVRGVTQAMSRFLTLQVFGCFSCTMECSRAIVVMLWNDVDLIDAGVVRCGSAGSKVMLGSHVEGANLNYALQVKLMPDSWWDVSSIFVGNSTNKASERSGGKMKGIGMNNQQA